MLSRPTMSAVSFSSQITVLVRALKWRNVSETSTSIFSEAHRGNNKTEPSAALTVANRHNQSFLRKQGHNLRRRKERDMKRFKDGGGARAVSGKC